MKYEVMSYPEKNHKREKCYMNPQNNQKIRIMILEDGKYRTKFKKMGDNILKSFKEDLPLLNNEINEYWISFKGRRITVNEIFKLEHTKSNFLINRNMIGGGRYDDNPIFSLEFDAIVLDMRQSENMLSQEEMVKEVGERVGSRGMYMTQEEFVAWAKADKITKAGNYFLDESLKIFFENKTFSLYLNKNTKEQAIAEQEKMLRSFLFSDIGMRNLITKLEITDQKWRENLVEWKEDPPQERIVIKEKGNPKVKYLKMDKKILEKIIRYMGVLWSPEKVPLLKQS
jgi:hypothetical protein